MNMPFMALDLRDPVSVTAETSGHNKDSYPKWSIIQYEFAATDKRPAVKMTWYDGGKRPPWTVEGAEISGSGSLLVAKKANSTRPTTTGHMKLSAASRPLKSSSANRPDTSKNRGSDRRGRLRPVNFAITPGPLTEMVLLAIWRCGPPTGERPESRMGREESCGQERRQFGTPDQARIPPGLFDLKEPNEFGPAPHTAGP